MASDIQKLSKREIAEIVETSERAFWEASWRDASPEVEARMKMHLHAIDGASAFVMENNRNPFFNRVVGLGLHQPATESVIDGLFEYYSQYDGPWTVTVSPQAQPEEIGPWLEARGFTHASNLAIVIRGDEPPPDIETDLRIERVDASTAELFAEVNCRGFELPDNFTEWYRPLLVDIAKRDDIMGYIAYDGEKPAASGLIHISGEVGGLFAGSTLPEYRRRGAQGAIMARRIQDGLEAGCRWFSTQAAEDTLDRPNPSYHNMLRTGFELAYLRPNYVLQPE